MTQQISLLVNSNAELQTNASRSISGKSRITSTGIGALGVDAIRVVVTVSDSSRTFVQICKQNAN